MLFLISSSPDTKQFQTALRTAQEMKADICLLQNAVYASRSLNDNSIYILKDDLMLRGIRTDNIKGKSINYEQLVDLMTASEQVVGLL